ncbi:MAG: signal peptidase I [Acidobacteriaceae bacterium]|nr:signal peptidase I [Acidobacteriaceae bacterium]
MSHLAAPAATSADLPSTSAVGLSVPTPSLLQTLQSLLYIMVVALFILTFSAQPFRIPSASMESTLQIGDFLLVNKQVTPGLFPALASASEIHRGDIIVFHYPVDPAKDLVKRVIGLPGDRLRLRSGRVYLNDRALIEPYAIYRSSSADSYRDEFPRLERTDPDVDSRWWIQMHTLVSHGELTVPADSYFVLGDNRNDSEDSRYWGFVPRAAIVGKPFLIYFSLNQPATQSDDSEDDASAQPSTKDTTVQTHFLVEYLFHLVRWNRTLSIPR